MIIDVEISTPVEQAAGEYTNRSNESACLNPILAEVLAQDNQISNPGIEEVCKQCL